MCMRSKIRAFNFMDPPDVVANTFVRYKAAALKGRISLKKAWMKKQYDTGPIPPTLIIISSSKHRNRTSGMNTPLNHLRL